MGSTLEGDVDAILNAVRRCHKELRTDSSRTLIELSIDDRQAASGERVRSLQRLHEATEHTPLARASQPTQKGRETQQDVRRIFRGTASGTRRS
jgi:hypothetical protein